MTLVSGNIMYIWIFARIPLGEDVIRQHGCRIVSVYCGYFFRNFTNKAGVFICRYVILAGS